MTKTELETAAFDYHLPKKLIATHPPKERASSRLLVVDRATGEIVSRKDW